MPSNPYIENEEKWKSLSDIDWFTQFIRVWITFNAWYRNNYPNLSADREIINEVKKNGNRARDKAENFIQRNDIDALKFKQHIADLYKLLEENVIRNKGKRVQLVGENSLGQEIFERRGITYEADLLPGNQYVCNVTSSTGQEVVSITLTEYDETALLGHPDYCTKLSPEQQRNLLACYKTICPELSLLSSNPANEIDIGGYKFINDPTLISQAVVETVYKLRCVLFHGEIIPDKNTARIYEPAYHLLKMIVD